MIILGITGTIGAGKGTVVDYLIKNKSFKHYAVRDFLTKEILSRGMPVNRDTMVVVANDLRKKNGAAFIIEKLYEEASKNNSNAVIESIRTPGEIDLLNTKPSFFLLAVDAKPEVRYQRIKQRRSETDHVDFKTFLENEKREMHAKDPYKQNLSACIKRADYVFNNDGSLQDLFNKIESFYSKIVQKN